MKTREEMIEAIYKKIADKTLKIWTKIKRKVNWKMIDDIILWKKDDCIYRTDLWYVNIITQVLDFEKYNPVMIWDVFDYFQIETAIELFDMDYSWPQDNWYSKVFNKWKYKRLPIEKQSDECIKFVFDLLPKE